MLRDRFRASLDNGYHDCSAYCEALLDYECSWLADPHGFVLGNHLKGSREIEAFGTPRFKQSWKQKRKQKKTSS